jgi:hypothetical protein
VSAPAAIEPRRGGWIQMFGGVQVWPLDVRAEDLKVATLIHHLSLRNRWNCATVIFYSCAQHSFLVAHRAHQLALQHGGGDERALLCARWGLIHDLTDAIFPDVPTPLKVLPEFAFFRAAEKAALRAICGWLELPEAEPEEVKLADLEVRMAEARDLLFHPLLQLPPGPYPFGVEEIIPLDGTVVAEAPWVAERSYRARWEALFLRHTPASWDRPVLPAVAR